MNMYFSRHSMKCTSEGNSSRLAGGVSGIFDDIFVHEVL